MKTLTPKPMKLRNSRKAVRKAPRSAVKVECRRAPGLGKNLVTQFLDISEGGVRVEVAEAVDFDEELEVLIFRPSQNKPIKRIANVCWSLPISNGDYCVGLEFQKRLQFVEVLDIAKPAEDMSGTDAALKDLANLSRTQKLDLFNTKLTDAGLKGLAPLKHLQKLNLGWTKVTDAGLKDLAPLKQLQQLNLGRTKVTDAGLKDLARFKHLQELNLSLTQVTDAGLKELAPLKELQELCLNNTNVTDAGLKNLAALSQLQRLDLFNTQVTDAGLKELAGLTNLLRLELFGTKVTDAGIQELKKALPQCQIN
jgi:PilZ domain/Leucine Rich repeat